MTFAYQPANLSDDPKELVRALREEFFALKRGLEAFGALNLPNTPAGNIAATTVQAALNELDGEKAALSGAAFTGAISVAGLATMTGGGSIPTFSADNTVNFYCGGLNAVANTTVGYPAFGYNITSGNAANRWRFSGADGASWVQFEGASGRLFSSTGVPAAGGLITEATALTWTNAAVTIPLKVTHSGYTLLGASSPALQCKKLTGTTGAAQGNLVTVAHGLTGAKILGLDVAVANSANNGILPNIASLGGSAGFEYSVWWDGTNVSLYNSAANSANILSKAFTVLITYEE